MRNVFFQSSLILLCVAASAGAQKKPRLDEKSGVHRSRLPQKRLAKLTANQVRAKLDQEAADLTEAAKYGYVATTRALLAQGADPNGGGNRSSPLFWAAADGRTECVRLLLRYGANPIQPCFDDSLAIDSATSSGHVSIVKMLIWRMPRLDHYDAQKYLRAAWNVALNNAVSTRPLGEIRAALSAGANVNTLEGGDNRGDGSPLMRATARGSLPIMKFLLARGAKVDLRDEQGKTALMFTGEVNRAAPTWLLLHRGAKVDIHDIFRMTPLIYAAQGNPKATALLVERGAPIAARDETGRTALHWAASVRDAKSIAILLRHGANVNARDNDGETALMLASVNPDAPVSARKAASRRAAIQVLLRHGANSQLKDKQGRTSSIYSKMQDMDFVNAS